MFVKFAISKLAATAAVLALGLASAGTAKASATLNWNFFLIGPNGNPVCSSIPGAPSGGPSAAADWSQFAVVPGSYICTHVEPFGFLNFALRVRTNGGAWPAAAMGNGFAQSFSPLSCAVASYWYKVVSGEVLGNLVSVKGPFVNFNTTLHNTNGAWKHFSSIATNVNGLAWETLSPVGILPSTSLFTAPVEYLIRDAQVNACVGGLSPVKDLSQYLAYDPFWYIKNPGGPVMTVRITNTSSVKVDGPIHIFLDGMTQGRSVVNPDGDYLGSPFVTLASSSLAPGQSEEVTVQFNADTAGSIPSFRVRLGSGAF